MADESEETRNPREAIEEIREKREEGEEPDADEREFLEGERVKVDRDAGEPGAPLDLGQSELQPGANR